MRNIKEIEISRLVSKRVGCTILTAAFMVFAMPSVAKEGDTFRPYASISVSQDDNLLRYDSRVVLPDSVESSDTIVKTAAGINVNWKLSRQLIVLNAGLSDSKYSNNSRLDNQGESLSAAWNWTLGSKLNGRVGYSRNKTLSSFTDNQTVALSGAQRTTQNYSVTGFWLLSPDWRTGVSLSSTDSEYNNATSQTSNTDSNATELSLLYLGFAGNSLGVKFRQNNTEFPERIYNDSSTVDNQYQLSSVLAVLNWQLAGKSRLQGQVGLESLANRHVKQRDYSDVTARLTYQLTPTGKFQFKASAWSEIQSSWIFDAVSQRVQAIEISPSWQMSAKNSLMFKYTLENLTYDGDSGATDDRKSWSVFWINKLFKNLNITVGYANNQRDSTRSLRDYQSNMFTINAKLIW